MDYKFYPNSNFLELSKNSNEAQIINTFGVPDKIEKEDYCNENESIDFDITYIYQRLGLKIMLSFYNNQHSSTSIFTKRLDINDINIFSLSKNKVLSIISNISKTTKMDALKDVTLIDKDNYEEYNYKDIGLILWFENDVLDEICVCFDS